MNGEITYFEMMCKSIEWNREQMKIFPANEHFFSRRKSGDLVALVRSVDKYNALNASEKIEIKFENGCVVGVDRI